MPMIHIAAELPRVIALSVEVRRWYPNMPPSLPGETMAQYSDRLTGADKTNRIPYNHRRNRQCSLGYHDECSDPYGKSCECPCHG